MHFGDFNPLEVLANAAVQRTGVDATAANDDATRENAVNNNIVTSESSAQQQPVSSAHVTQQQKTSEKPPLVHHHDAAPLNNVNATSAATLPPGTTKPFKAVPCVVKMVSNTSGGANLSSASSHAMQLMKDATKIVIPNKNGSSKTLTVVKINNKHNATTSLTSLHHAIDVSKGDEDEGYCSRSSLDSPGQCTRTDSDVCERDSDVIKSPKTTSAQQGCGKVTITSLSSPILKTPPVSFKPPSAVATVDRGSKSMAKIVI